MNDLSGLRLKVEEWYNVYCRKEIESSSWIQILDEAICNSLQANALGHIKIF